MKIVRVMHVLGMTKYEATKLQVATNEGVWYSDWARDTFIIELGYTTTFDLYHLDDVMYGGFL